MVPRTQMLVVDLQKSPAIEGLEIEVEHVAHHAIVSVLVRRRSHSGQST